MITVDKFLGGHVLLKQPEKGYRAGIDAVLLAAAVYPSGRVLDVGAGVGAVMLCLSHHHPSAPIIGLELQSEMVALGQQNILLNHKQDLLNIYHGSIMNPPVELAPNSFDHVVTNPPYFGYGASALEEVKTLSKHESETDLAAWINACLRMVKPRGYITMIHRAERLDSIINAIGRKAGDIKIFPLWPSEGQPAKLVIIQARKGVKTACKLLPGLVLHQVNKEYTLQADSILRGLTVIANEKLGLHA